jgi:hypothetical protein
VQAAQEKPPAAPALTPTETQSLRLRNKQLEALLAKTAADAAQQHFQQALADLNAEAERVKTEQHWPKDTQFSMNDLSFTPAPPPAKPAEPAKDKAAKP